MFVCRAESEPGSNANNAKNGFIEHVIKREFIVQNQRNKSIIGAHTVEREKCEKYFVKSSILCAFLTSYSFSRILPTKSYRGIRVLLIIQCA